MKIRELESKRLNHGAILALANRQELEKQWVIKSQSKGHQNGEQTALE